VLVASVTIVGGACATKGGVPRPFPVATRAPEGAVVPSDHAPTPTGAPGENPLTPTGAPPADPAAPSPVDRLLDTALGLLGLPYRNGGSDPSGFDCSGFVQYVFARHGTALPREVRTQFLLGRAITLDEVVAGDLVFFETVSRGASHVGIAVGNGRFVHAPSSRGVIRVEPYTASYWARRFVGARRMHDVSMAERRSFPGAIHASE